MLWVLLLLSLPAAAQAQEITLNRGGITDSLQLTQTPGTVALYLPKNFNATEQYSLILILEKEGKARQALGTFREVAESEGYILASPNMQMDTLSISDQVIFLGKLGADLKALLPVAPRRFYTAGFGVAGQLAVLAPSFLKDIGGAIGISAPIPSTEILDKDMPYYYIGIVGDEDFNFGNMKSLQKKLDSRDLPHHLLVFDGGHSWPSQDYLKKALQLFKVYAMKRGNLARDPEFLAESLEFQLREIRQLQQRNEFIRAYEQMLGVYRVYEGQGLDLDSLKQELRKLKKDRRLKTQKRELENQLFLEALQQEDYLYYLEEDLRTANFNNLGWWRYQYENLLGGEAKKQGLNKKTMIRLAGYLNALTEDYIAEIKRDADPDLGGLQFLYMLKTVIDPEDPQYYLDVISTAAQVEDFGTALFYLEELLKQGYRDKDTLYALPNTALLRITPEFNDIIDRYFEDPRYEPDR